MHLGAFSFFYYNYKEVQTMNKLLNFDNPHFEGKLANMDTIFTIQLKDIMGYQPTKKYTKKFQTVPAKTMDVLYDTLRAYKGTLPSVNAAVAKIKGGLTAEISDDSGTCTCVFIGKRYHGAHYVKAGIVNELGVIQSFNFTKENKMVILLALMPLFLEDEETKQIYDSMSDYLEWDVDSPDWDVNNAIQDFAILLNKMSTNVQTMLEDGTVNIDVDTISILKQDNLEVSDIKEYAGTLKHFHEKAETPIEAAAVKEPLLDGNFKYSDYSHKMAAKLSSTYIMPNYVEEICTYFKMSSDFPAPMRVCYLLGPAGTGKTEAAKAICALTGLPYDHYTCNPNTEIFDFLGQMLPNVNGATKSFDDIRRELGLPSTEDIINDPGTSYEAVFGRKCAGYPDEGAIVKTMVEKVMEAASANQKDFTYVESGLVKAIKNGYGFEIQEIGCVMRPGVAVGLNALLETGENSFLTLPTGEVVRRHPDCTIIFTSNDEYEGTCNLNQSVLDRMSLVYRIENPPKEVMMERILARTHFPDVPTLQKMVDVIYHLSTAAKEKDITDGVCGYRSLENWCMAAMIQSRLNGGKITDDICYKTAIMTVMNKVSQHVEFVEELMSSLTYYFAAPNNI